MEYREMELKEADKIKFIDATCFIKNAWRNVDGKVQLIEINWTDYELPNGLPWHIDRFQKTVQAGGKAYGCFEGARDRKKFGAVLQRTGKTMGYR